MVSLFSPSAVPNTGDTLLSLVNTLTLVIIYFVISSSTSVSVPSMTMRVTVLPSSYVVKHSPVPGISSPCLLSIMLSGIISPVSASLTP